MENNLKPAFENNNIPIAFATDDRFAPYLYISIKSLLSNANEKYNYDLVIFHGLLKDYHKQKLAEFEANNVTVRFINMSEYMDSYKESWYIHWGYSEAVYYRFFIAEIFKNYEKVLYLDGDVIFNSDISELYNINIDTYYAAAIQDTARQMSKEKVAEYSETVLKIPRQYYFNAGIMLYNIKELKNIKFLEQCINTLNRLKTPLLQDQDVLNVVCNKKIKYLPLTYNLTWNCLHYYSDAKDRMPEDIYNEYIESWKNPKAIHYAGAYKPWIQPWLEYSEYFWKYARQTPYYEEIIYRNCKSNINRINIQNAVQKNKIYLNYFKCKLLSFITFGKAKEHYMEKKTRLKNKVNDYRTTLGRKL